MLKCLASLAMSTSVLEALPGKLDIKILSPSILCILTSSSHMPLFRCTLCVLWSDPPISTVTLIPSHYKP